MSYGAEQLVVAMKALADPVRLRIVVLCAQGECSVSELTQVLGLSQPRVSQHLKQLCDAGLLERFRDGHFVYYRVLSGRRQAALRRKLLGLVPMDDPGFAEDTA
ncbi:MAG TPA: metalloregulator ArsR/SmtB family transcription factor, partial [Woeseiaceae bacterium]|nr:metalloregulator ArsR/SmtB family transcription factor [Woeseiaceae bacterium]